MRIDQRFGAQHVSQFRDGADESHAWSLVSILSGLIFCLLHPGVNRNLDVSGYGAHALRTLPIGPGAFRLSTSATQEGALSSNTLEVWARTKQ